MAVIVSVPVDTVANAGTTRPWVTSPDGLVMWRQSTNTAIQLNCITQPTQVAWGDPNSTVTNPASPFATGNWYPNTTASYVIVITYPDGGGPPGFIQPPGPIITDCVRRAWLTLGTTSIELHNPDAGWVCDTLNLGYPEVRAVVNNRPDQHGIDDRTRFYGARAVSADLVTTTGWGARIDDVADSFAPFMRPDVRPVLHFILDRGNNDERTLTVRAADYGWPILDDYERAIHLAWIAADPIARSTSTSTATAWSGASVGAGRAYNLTFDRTYPTGTSSPPTGIIRPTGDVPVQPLYRVFGPITGPKLHFPGMRADGTAYTFDINFVASLTIGASQWIDIDSANKTARLMGDPTQSVQTSIDWATTTWGSIDPAPGYSNMQLTGTSTSDNTQVTAFWTEGFLT